MLSHAPKYMDRRPGSNRRSHSPSHGRDRSLDGRLGDHSEEWRSHKKQCSLSPEKHTQDLELSGLLGLSSAEPLAAVSALMAKPMLVPSHATRDGLRRLLVPLDARHKVARGDKPIPIQTMLSVYIVAGRWTRRSPQPTQQ